MPQRKLLLIEDHEDTLHVYARLLTEWGFDVHPAASCAQAEETAERRGWCIDLIVVDVDLPDGDGAELARRFASRCRCAVLVLTASGTPSDIQRYEELGLVHCLIKPTDLQQLHQAIERSLTEIRDRDRE